MATSSIDLFSNCPTDDRIVSSEDHNLQVTFHGRERLYFGGYGQVTVLEGVVQILGATFTPRHGPVPIFSPKSTSVLHVSNAIGCELASVVISSLPNGPEILQEGEPSVASMFSFPSPSCVPSFTLVRKQDSDCVPFDAPADWLSVASGLTSALSYSTPIIFVVGPRKVGKSTMSRFLANSLWSHAGQVAFLDLDSGQTEFTPPGCLSLNLVKKNPLLGPPMSHQCITEGLVYLGTTSPSDDPKGYLKGAKQLINQYLCDYHPNGIPLVVNTMGWVTGLGMSLLQSLLHAAPVTHMIAFSNGEQEPYGYVQQALFESSCFSPAFSAEQAPQTAYVHASESSGTASSRLSRISPVDLRSLTFSSYFLGKFDAALSRMVYETGSFPPSFRSAQPLSIPIASIRIKCTDKSVRIPKEHLPLALNLAMVGLANFDNGKTQCYALGLVRSVDPVKGLYYVITPAAPEFLEEKKINCFLFGRIQLPNTFLLTSENANGPYVSYFGSNSLTGAGNAARKTRSNIGRKGQLNLMEGSGGGNGDAEKRQQQEQARRNMLDQILTMEARERLSRISLVKPEKGRSLEDWLIQAMQSGKVRNRITEPDLLSILDQIDAQEQKQKSSKIVYQRRTFLDDDD